MNPDAYRLQVEAAWKRNRPHTFLLMAIPLPWSGRLAARSVAARLADLVAELTALEPPEEDEREIRDRYLEPLTRASGAASEFAESRPLGSRFADTVVLMDEAMALWSNDDDHDFVVRYGLPQWWLPRTDSREPRSS